MLGEEVAGEDNGDSNIFIRVHGQLIKLDITALGCADTRFCFDTAFSGSVSDFGAKRQLELRCSQLRPKSEVGIRVFWPAS